MVAVGEPVAGKIPLLLAACLGSLCEPTGRAFVCSASSAKPKADKKQVIRWMPWHLNKEGRDKYEKSWLEVKPR